MEIIVEKNYLEYEHHMVYEWDTMEIHGTHTYILSWKTLKAHNDSYEVHILPP